MTLDELEKLTRDAPDGMEVPRYKTFIMEKNLDGQKTEAAFAFYQAARAEMLRLIGLVREYYKLLQELDDAPLVRNPPELETCSFCGKQKNEVNGFIVGPNFVSICNECVEQSREILATDRETEEMIENLKDNAIR